MFIPPESNIPNDVIDEIMGQDIAHAAATELAGEMANFLAEGLHGEERTTFIMQAATELFRRN